MTQRIVLLCLLATLAFSTSACHTFRRHKSEPNTPAADVASTFKQRWIAKRVNELTAAGKSQADAEAQARQDYEKEFQYLNAK